MLDRTKTEKKISQIKLQMIYDINERLRGLKVATLAEFVVPCYHSGPISAKKREDRQVRTTNVTQDPKNPHQENKFTV